MYIMSMASTCCCCTSVGATVISAMAVAFFLVLPFNDGMSFPQIASAIWKSLAHTLKLLPLFTMSIASLTDGNPSLANISLAALALSTSLLVNFPRFSLTV